MEGIANRRKIYEKQKFLTCNLSTGKTEGNKAAQTGRLFSCFFEKQCIFPCEKRIPIFRERGNPNI